MKFNKIILPSIALATIMASCDDQIMEWQDKDGSVDASELPLKDSEKLLLYKPIKEYVAQHHPNLNLALGVGADLYLNDPEAKSIIDANFTGITLGNAMKMGVIMNASGNIDFTTVDNVLAAMPAGMKLYGHNLLWHTQQPQTYLKSLIAPKMEVVVDQQDVCINIISNSDFEDGTDKGWTGFWGQYDREIVSPGHDSQYALKMTNKSSATDMWSSQLFWESVMEKGKTYAYSFWAKSDAGVTVQFIGSQASGDYKGIYKDQFELGSDWVYCTGEFEYTDADPDDITRWGIQFGGVPGGSVYIDDFKFGLKNDAPANPDEGRLNYIANGTFDENIDGCQKWNGADGCNTWNSEEGNFGKGCLQVVNATANPGNQWKTQIHLNLSQPIAVGNTAYISYYIRTLEGSGSARVSTTGDVHYQGDQNVPNAWVRVEWSFDVAGNPLEGINFDLGEAAATYLIDDIYVSTDPFKAEAKATPKAGGITFVPKTAEEKKTILLDAMEQWIKSIMEHVGDRVDAWDVINEPIADGSNGWRGIDGVFGSNNNDGVADSEPVETETDGLTLNWASEAGNQHWYWGYYLGKDYAVKAFEFARRYAPNAKLFVNEYNLETSPSKLDALIGFVNYIDQNGGQVDGIGTQMHVNYKISKDQVDAMFKKLAQTGKLIRITELDVAFGVEEGKTITPSEAQLSEQAATYQMILTSYFENIPEAQQSAITIWGFSDNKKEHEYWLKGDAPNIFDSEYKRKVAYKGVCDAIAGYDVSIDFKGEDWKELNEGEEENSDK